MKETISSAHSRLKDGRNILTTLKALAEQAPGLGKNDKEVVRTLGRTGLCGQWVCDIQMAYHQSSIVDAIVLHSIGRCRLTYTSLLRMSQALRTRGPKTGGTPRNS